MGKRRKADLRPERPVRPFEMEYRILRGESTLLLHDYVQVVAGRWKYPETKGR
jgi:hypothetical protein